MGVMNMRIGGFIQRFEGIRGRGGGGGGGGGVKALAMAVRESGAGHASHQSFVVATHP